MLDLVAREPPPSIDGYRSDIAYTAHHQPELNPARLAIAARGWFDPDKPFTAIDLGCGYGLSTLFHAAAYPDATFVGVDARGGHISWATGTATAADLDNATFLHATFDEVGARLPQADVMTAHGVWSWVTDDVRRQVLAVIATCLKPGGIFYVSYNALPGMASMLPVREQLVAAFRRAGGGIEQRIAAAFADTIAALPDQPEIVARLRRLATAPSSYLAHEFFQDQWRCFTADEVAAACAECDLQFVGAAGIIGDSNDDFRADLFVRRGATRGQPPEFADISFAPLVDRESFARVPRTSPTTQRLLHRLARAPASAAEIAAESLFASVPRTSIEATLSELLAHFVIEPVLAPSGLDRRKDRTDRLNRALWAQALVSDDVAASVSPVTGSGVHVTRIEQLFLAALVRQGDPITTAADVLGAEHRDQIAGLLKGFEARRLPLLKALGVI